VAGTDGGGFVVVWASDLGGKNGLDIFGQRFSASGNRNGKQFRINARREKDQIQPAVAASPNGGFTVVWASEQQDGSGFGIVGRRFDSAGETADPDLAINETTKNDQSQPSIATLADGRVIVTWTSVDQDGSKEGVFGRFLEAGDIEDAEKHAEVGSTRMSVRAAR
jgi:hypothetical protein